MPEQEATINLMGGDTVGVETDYRDALPVNMSGIKDKILNVAGYMLQQSGLTHFASAKGIDRGGNWNERHFNHYRVSGQRFVEIDNGGSVKDLGAIGGIDTVSLPYSFDTQAIVANGRFYLYDKTNGLVEVTDSDLGDPIDGVWIDGYYMLTDGEFLFHTRLGDESAIDPLKFATAEFSPDPTLGVGKTVDNKVIAFGRYSIEYFANVASENFAFTRIPNRAIKTGIVGTHCKCEMLSSWFIVGGRKEEDVSVHVVGVGAVTKIASREIDKILGQYTEAELSVAVLEPRVEEDYHYLILHLPNETLIYNHEIAQVAGMDMAWSILKSDTSGNRVWRGKHGIFEPRLGKFVYGDKLGGEVGILDELVATHYGEIVEYIMHTPFLILEKLSLDELEIYTVAGFTNDIDAKVAISITYDGIHYSTEWFAKYADPSEYLMRFIIRRLGYIRSFFSLKLRIVSKSKMAFSQAKIKFS